MIDKKTAVKAAKWAAVAAGGAIFLVPMLRLALPIKSCKEHDEAWPLRWVDPVSC